jgi:hypothetical protein
MINKDGRKDEASDHVASKTKDKHEAKSKHKSKSKPNAQKAKT